MSTHVAEAKLTVEDKSLTLPGVPATDGADALGISALLKETGTVTYDAGFVNTASTKSSTSGRCTFAAGGCASVRVWSAWTRIVPAFRSSM